MNLGILLLFIAQDTVLVSAIIMICELGTTRFMKVFGPSVGRRPWLLLLSLERLVIRYVYVEGLDEKA